MANVKIVGIIYHKHKSSNKYNEKYQTKYINEMNLILYLWSKRNEGRHNLKWFRIYVVYLCRIRTPFSISRIIFKKTCWSVSFHHCVDPQITVDKSLRPVLPLHFCVKNSLRLNSFERKDFVSTEALLPETSVFKFSIFIIKCLL